MLSLVSATVHETTFSQPTHITAPSPIIMKLFSAIHWVHKTWHWYRKSQIYTKPKNVLSLAAGHVVEYLAGSSLAVRTAATCVYIASRILACVTQYKVLSSACKKVSYAIKGSFPHQQCRCSTQNANILSPSTTNSICKFGNQFTGRSKQIALSIAQVFKEIFILSMTMLDAINAFYFDPQASKEQIRELFVNAEDMMTNLTENQTQLVSKLRDNALIIDRVLKLIQPDTSADQLINSINENLQKTRVIKQKWDEVKDEGERFVKIFSAGCCDIVNTPRPDWTSVEPRKTVAALPNSAKPIFFHTKSNKK